MFSTPQGIVSIRSFAYIAGGACSTHLDKKERNCMESMKLEKPHMGLNMFVRSTCTCLLYPYFAHIDTWPCVENPKQSFLVFTLDILISNKQAQAWPRCKPKGCTGNVGREATGSSSLQISYTSFWNGGTSWEEGAKPKCRPSSKSQSGIH